MLDAARHEAGRQGIGHIEFGTPDELFGRRGLGPSGGAKPRRFDLVNCTGVLQRLEPAHGLALLRELLALIAPGGAGAFQLPFQSAASLAVEWSRRARELVPGLNAAVNLLRGKPAGDPFIPSHVYDLGAVFRLLHLAGVRATHLVFDRQEGLAAAIIFVEASPSPAGAALAGGALPAAVAPPIAVRQLIASTSVEALDRTAEEYFASLTTWDHHLAKPFNNPDEAPLTLLFDVAILLQGLRLSPGARVLKFGAGTGWLSRFLTQLGCHAVLLDVSLTALGIARELYARQPVVGDRPAPRIPRVRRAPHRPS